MTTQNMMYTHTITVYDRSHRLVKVIPDSVRLSDFGITGVTSQPVLGAPVEAAFAPDGSHWYVSNYSMYGPGMGREGFDACTPASRVARSYVYRLSGATLSVDAVIPVGAVPKFLTVTPDGRYLLVSNWCSWYLSVVDTTTNQEVRRLPTGAYPRGIAVSPDSRTAYVAVMGTTTVLTVNLATWATGTIGGVGDGPRHVVLSPDGRWLYVTLNADGRVAKLDTATNRVVARAAVGVNPRSMAISADGRSLYLVNYGSSSVSKVRTEDMVVLQTVTTNADPIGISVDPVTGEVWVSCYSGSVMVFADQPPGASVPSPSSPRN